MPHLLERLIELFVVIEGGQLRPPLSRYLLSSNLVASNLSVDVINDCRAGSVLILNCSHETDSLHEECGADVANDHRCHDDA